MSPTKRPLSAVILLLFLFAGTALSRTTPVDFSTLDDLPGDAHGLTVRVRAEKDTFLLGEPVALEVFLHNRGTDTLHDYCMLNPHYGDIQIYAIRGASTAVRFEPEMRGEAGGARASYLAIPPGRCVGSLIVFGTKGLLTASSARGPYEFKTHHFREVGRHRVLATYRRRPARDEGGRPPVSHVIVSTEDSFFVAEPEGWDKSIFEAIGEDIFRVDVRGRREKPGGAKAIAESQRFLHRICLADSASVYAPWLRAAYARGYILGWPGVSGYGPATVVLEEMVERFPEHRLSQEMEFRIGRLLCAGGLHADARAFLNRLLLKYPANVRAYHTCREDIRVPVVREGVAVAGRCATDR